MKLLRKLYDWILTWADKPFGGIFLFFLSFIEACVFPLPPDPLLIALVLGHRKKFLKFAALCTVGSVLGGLFGYFIGYQLWHLTSEFFFNYVFPANSDILFDKLQVSYNKHSFGIVFISGFTPIPYKIFTISSGVFKIPIFGFIIASIIGRGTRFFLVSALVAKYGNHIKNFIDKYFNILTIAFTIAIIAGFFAIKFFWK